MALFEEQLKIGTPVLIGIGALILAPTVVPILGAVAKPLVKAAIKGGLIFIYKGRELISETAEALEDVAAEVRAELIAERSGSTESEHS